MEIKGPKINLFNYIIPLKQSTKVFFMNLWHLRGIFFVLFILLIINSSCLLVAFNLSTDEHSKKINFFDSLYSSFDYIVPFKLSEYIPGSLIEKIIALFNSVLGIIIFVMLIWIIQESLKDQPLKKARCVFFAKK